MEEDDFTLTTADALTGGLTSAVVSADTITGGAGADTLTLNTDGHTGAQHLIKKWRNAKNEEVRAVPPPSDYEDEDEGLPVYGCTKKLSYVFTMAGGGAHSYNLGNISLLSNPNPNPHPNLTLTLTLTFIFVLFFNLGIDAIMRDEEHLMPKIELFREDAEGRHDYYGKKLMFRYDDDGVEHLLVVDKDREDLCGWIEIDGEWVLEFLH